MKFNVGDKVSFLNENLSGRITRIINEGICKVETGDGFEIDANEKELVLVSKAETSEVPSSIEIIKPLIEPILKLNTDLFSILENDAIHFVSMPAEDMQVLTGGVNFYLINKTGCLLHFSFSVKIKNKFFGLVSGSVEPQSEFLLLNKKRPDMIDWQNFILQFILFKEDEYKIIAPVNNELPLLLPDLKAEFDQLKGMESYSKTIKLVAVGKETEVDMEELKKKFSKDEETSRKSEPGETREAAKEKIPPRKTPFQQDTSAIIRNDAEVDLHIQHLVDDYKHLSNAELMQIQLKKFRREMDNAIKNHYHKIIFIHGVGNGVLRTEILRELRAYSGVRYIDAPFEKYGFGATEVILI
ncbi:MAG TPA: DUF2027 domain-containing protein [Bacteroidia bacterium]|nr:DUF2027 domain-containing protein [Bacteroidia bacterium]